MSQAAQWGFWLGEFRVTSGKSKAMRLASSYVITTCATLAAILLFVGLGSQLLPASVGFVPLPATLQSLKLAFILNVAIILFGWFRAKDLKEAIEAWEQAERTAHRNANVDHATGLANRREFMRTLHELLTEKGQGALLLIDLDHFKRVNDLHGHTAGDQLLSVIADILGHSARGGALCARIGGDEFALLLPGAVREEADARASALLEAIAKPVRTGSSTLNVTASIGLATFDSSLDETAILRRSDVALYAAKKEGRNAFAWYNDELESELSRRNQLDEDIRHGIERGEFVPYFQPLIDLNTRDLAGFEALARWNSPTRGLVEPDDFVPQAEVTGLIGPLTMSIMEQALTEARGWPAHLKVAVNVSPVQFRDLSFAQHVMRILTATGFPARRLELEITEAALLEDRDQVLATIRSLKSIGVSISLDDFGTGYASLAELDTLPVDRIKIDRTFITRFVKSERTAAIVDAIAMLGHKLNVPLTAEGVESEQIRVELSALGCSEAQGWLYGRAVSADTVASFLEMRTPEPETEAAPPEPIVEKRRGTKF
ncbi:EAL domain-containing protein [Sphingomonas sabuli]|uniref:EAL domain-containing protein n=1 Tax=Sphingomonas sabuli TaxID=2764186 RepID=A0A7G9L1N5_9SPHN|nr:EAL domain-containing protein [Sphingomonas sabuli]QNM82534.1 EAL domain-containing protein [Sphingomonas sabuli]